MSILGVLFGLGDAVARWSKQRERREVERNKERDAMVVRPDVDVETPKKAGRACVPFTIKTATGRIESADRVIVTAHNRNTGMKLGQVQAMWRHSMVNRDPATRRRTFLDVTYAQTEAPGCGYGTRLYEAVAKEACDAGGILRSDQTLTNYSEGFWKKQVKKKRAIFDEESDRFVLKSCNVNLQAPDKRRRR